MRILKILGDRAFHEVGELTGQSSVGEVVAGVSELLATGHAFDASGDRRRVRLRMREPDEERQTLLGVVGSLDWYPVRLESREEPEESGEEGGSASGAASVAEGSSPSPGLVLSDPPEALTLPASWVAGLTCAILSTRGAGKSYLAGVFVEELRAVVPEVSVVVFDPTGAWAGLASTADGEPSGLGVVVLGGESGVAQLDAGSGRRAAGLVRDMAPCSMVCDLSGMSRSEAQAFAADFFEQTATLSSFQLHVVLDEADMFVPQRFGALGGDERRCSAAVEEYFFRGRKSGKGGTIISLRPAVVSKNVLSVAECLFLLRLTETNDLRAVEAWLDNFEHGVGDAQRREALAQMPVLPTGTAYFLRGGEQALFCRFRVRRKRTFDSSRTLGSEGSAERVPGCVLSDDVLAKVRAALEGSGGEA